VLKKGCDFISVANFGPDITANTESTFKNFLLKSVDADLAELVELVKAGKLKLPVDSVVDFKDVPAALTKSLNSQNAGKLVIKINPRPSGSKRDGHFSSGGWILPAFLSACVSYVFARREMTRRFT
jgi:predicted phage tail protein